MYFYVRNVPSTWGFTSTGILLSGRCFFSKIVATQTVVKPKGYSINQSLMFLPALNAKRDFLEKT